MKQKKALDRFTLITSIITLLPLIYGLYFLDQLPDQLPTRFDFNGTITGYTQKHIFILAMPFIFAAINVFSHFMTNADPKRQNQSKNIRNLVKMTIPILVNTLYPATIYIALGNHWNLTHLVGVMVGILLIFIGNYLPKSDLNYTIGIRLPWTLQSPENWRKTHILAGRCYVFSGFIMLAMSFIPNGMIIAFSILMVCNLYTMYYSYLLYKKGV